MENPDGKPPPGRPIHDDGTMGAGLVMNEPGLVYAVSHEGRIRTINVLNELSPNRNIGSGAGGAAK
jgi:hypothetical protein